MLLEKPNNLNCFDFLKKQASKIFRDKKSSLLRDFIYSFYLLLFFSLDVSFVGQGPMFAYLCL